MTISRREMIYSCDFHERKPFRQPRGTRRIISIFHAIAEPAQLDITRRLACRQANILPRMN